MTIHFFYDFKDEMLKKLNEYFSDELEAFRYEKKQIDQINDAEVSIRNYFKNIVNDMSEIMEATNGMIAFDSEGDVISKLTIMKHYLKFTRKDTSIEVKIGYYIPEDDFVESMVLSYIVPGDKKLKIKRVGKIHDGSNFDENTLNYYMREAFGKLDFTKD
ncbi:MAG: hypothetical protein J7L15_07510 [Clostridiales bacterium]|nr:hypothetical protein [Clostridiales bacterium]